MVAPGLSAEHRAEDGLDHRPAAEPLAVLVDHLGIVGEQGRQGTGIPGVVGRDISLRRRLQGPLVLGPVRSGRRRPAGVAAGGCDRSGRVATAGGLPAPSWAETPATNPSQAQASGHSRQCVLRIDRRSHGRTLTRFQNLVDSDDLNRNHRAASRSHQPRHSMSRGRTTGDCMSRLSPGLR